MCAACGVCVTCVVCRHDECMVCVQHVCVVGVWWGCVGGVCVVWEMVYVRRVVHVWEEHGCEKCVCRWGCARCGTAASSRSRGPLMAE